MHKIVLTSVLAAFLAAMPAAAKSRLFQPAASQGKAVSATMALAQRGASLLRPKSVDESGTITPDFSATSNYFAEIQSCGTLIGPDDEDWFYTLEPVAEVMTQNPYYTQYDYTGFNIKVYDSKMNFVGQASGVLERPEDAKYCQSIVVGACVTRQFFAYGDDCEIMLIANYIPKVGSGSKQITYAYSLLPEGQSTPVVFQLPGVYVQALNAKSSYSENYWMAFFEESTWLEDAGKLPKFTVYRHASYDAPAQKVLDIDYDERFVSSDGISDVVLPLVMNNVGSTVYLATWRYEKTFFENPDDPTNDKLSEDNNLIIQLYKSSGNNLTLAKETKIPVTSPSADYSWRSYGMGTFFGANDLSFDYSTGDMPAYIISVVDSDILENQSTYYAVYDTDGNILKTFGNNNSGFAEMSDIPGAPRQICFDMESAVTGEWGLVMCDYPSMAEVGFIPKLFEHDGDIWSLGAVPDRVLTNKGILYAAPVQPTNGGLSASVQDIGWFKADGTLDHVDHLELEGNILKINTFIDAAVLNPFIFNTSNGNEYIHWVYTDGLDGSASRLALVITDDKGKMLATRQLPADNTYPFCYIANIGNNPSILITYTTRSEDGSRKDNMEIVSLPLNKFDGEGTVESPYLVRTFGDLDLMRNNLTSHFALANSIDCNGRRFRPIEGNFTGSLDGRGNEISGLNITTTSSGDAMFQKLGRRLLFDELESGEISLTGAIRNLTLYQPEFTAEASSGYKEYALLANEARYAEISNVHIVEPIINAPSDLRGTFGVMANSAYNTDIVGCSVLDADVELPTSTGVGGFVNILSGGSVKASAFSGKLTGLMRVGGIAVQNQGVPAVIKDCHVKADIAGESSLGGVMAFSSRSAISNTLVEGSITATEPVAGSDDKGKPTLQYKVGGVVGELSGFSYDEPDADDFMAIENCVVALDAINLSTADEFAKATAAHRIVGWTSIDGGEVIEWVEDPTSTSDSQKMKPIVHQPEAEKRIANNHVISALAPIEVASSPLATEGAEVEGAADQAWFVGLGYAFDGASNEEPWVLDSERPELFFETSASTALYFTESEIEGVAGTEINVPLVFRGIEPDAIMFGSTDEQGAAIANFVEPGEVVVQLIKPGIYTLTATNYFKTASLKVTVKEVVGLDQIGNDAAALIDFDGYSVKAQGCAIAIYNAQGQLVASGKDALSTASLVSGVYVAKAQAADGTSSTLKFAAK